MGWYRHVIAKFSSTYEAKIVKIDAERIARRILYYKGNSSPTQDYLNTIVAKTVSKLEEKFGSLDQIRRAASSEDLSSIIEKAVEEILPQK
jgi:hypothetical protein